MGSQQSQPAQPLDTNVPDATLSSDISTPEEDAMKRKAYAHIKPFHPKGSQNTHQNTIEQVYNEDFDQIDHIQSMRFPTIVARQIDDAVTAECERRCSEKEKTMARCLQDKMWTSWKCQKERDAYFYCVSDEQMRNRTAHPDEPDFVDLTTAYRWKYNLGVFHGEIIGRNNLMRELWRDHFPDRDLPQPWVKDD